MTCLVTVGAKVDGVVVGESEGKGWSKNRKMKLVRECAKGRTLKFGLHTPDGADDYEQSNKMKARDPQALDLQASDSPAPSTSISGHSVVGHQMMGSRVRDSRVTDHPASSSAVPDSSGADPRPMDPQTKGHRNVAPPVTNVRVVNSPDLNPSIHDHSAAGHHHAGHPVTRAQTTGQWGETLAADYLRDAGFEVLHRNWRCPPWELDLVACRGGVLHIVEVKSRRRGALTTPEEAMTPAKCRALYRAASRYVAKTRWGGDTQFDLIAIEFDDGGAYTLRYIPHVFTPHW